LTISISGNEAIAAPADAVPSRHAAHHAAGAGRAMINFPNIARALRSWLQITIRRTGRAEMDASSSRSDHRRRRRRRMVRSMATGHSIRSGGVASLPLMESSRPATLRRRNCPRAIGPCRHPRPRPDPLLAGPTCARTLAEHGADV